MLTTESHTFVGAIQTVRGVVTNEVLVYALLSVETREVPPRTRYRRQRVRYTQQTDRNIVMKYKMLSTLQKRTRTLPPTIIHNRYGEIRTTCIYHTQPHSRQVYSSEPSRQSSVPSHCSTLLMQEPVVQANSDGEHEVSVGGKRLLLFRFSREKGYHAKAYLKWCRMVKVSAC